MKTSLGLHSFFLLVLCCLLTKTQAQVQPIDLSGSWQFALDPKGNGITEKWYAKNLPETVQLPGTTDENKKGFLNKDTSLLHLNRVYTYQGAAWYRRKITIPKNWNGGQVVLTLERTKPTQVWVDNQWAGQNNLLQSAHKYNLTQWLSPGEHTITICVNNSLALTPYGNVHIYSDDTQTNWNGILGNISLQYLPALHLQSVQVYPNIEQKNIKAIITTANTGATWPAKIQLQALLKWNGKTTTLPVISKTIGTENSLEITYPIGHHCQLWNEHQQPLYELKVSISSASGTQLLSVPFGMRSFKANGTQFSINGLHTFLRGKHEAAVFPITGHTPADKASWLRVFRIARQYGINHYRFHSYCPPEAAFAAADEAGIYLQPELPFWGGMDNDTLAENLLKEGKALLSAYANHPSFVMFSMGNEIWSGHDRATYLMNTLKAYDSRPLYAFGSNNSIGYIPPPAGADFFVAARTPGMGDTTVTHIRLTHAFADTRLGGILNSTTPAANKHFEEALKDIKVPTISHEIGQYQIFPRFSEIKKYTGVLRAWNLENFKRRVQNAGLGQMDSAFQRASGAWSALCYKAEMEAAIGTKGMAGFQLLDLQDFPGQGTALVGILDAFMDSKNVIAPQAWKESCNDVVLLLEMPKYCYTSAEVFSAEVKVANYSNRAFRQPVAWRITNQKGQLVKQGTLMAKDLPAGALTKAGMLNLPLHFAQEAGQFQIEISLPGSSYQHHYPLWIYPEIIKPVLPASIHLSNRLNQEDIDYLHQGGSVLLLATDSLSVVKSSGPLFPPDFWNYGMFKSISLSNGKPVSPGTLGLLIENNHPVFRHFPTEFHTNWQWFSIIQNSWPVVLDALAQRPIPMARVIDNMERNYDLGLLFEAKVGKGKLMICAANLTGQNATPAMRQLYASILDYMQSAHFQPQLSLPKNELAKIFHLMP